MNQPPKKQAATPSAFLALSMLSAWTLFCLGEMQAQQSEFSPYSRFGFGLIEQINTPVYAGLGGMETTMISSYQFQPNNPASATYQGQTTFQGSGTGNRMSMKQGESDAATAAFGSPGPMGIVVKKQSGKSALILGLSPFSNSGYAISRTGEYDGIGTVQERYEGQGGLNNLNIGWARAFKGSRWVQTGANDSLRIQGSAVHLGVQSQYLFGEVSRTSSVDILDPTYLDHRSKFKGQHRSIAATAGIIYDQLLYVRYNELKDFERSLSLRLGGVFTPETNLHSSLSQLDETTQTLGGIAVNLDTAFYSARADYRARMPRSLSFGSSLHFDRADGMRISAGVEYKTSRWDEVAEGFAPEMQSNDVRWSRSESFRMGVQFNLSNPETRNPTWGKATYRFGILQQYQPYEINGSQVLTQSFTGGLTLPMVGSRSLSRLHFGTELGERITENGALEESFLRIHVGVSLMPFFKNNWLIPRLYD